MARKPLDTVQLVNPYEQTMPLTPEMEANLRELAGGQPQTVKGRVLRVPGLDVELPPRKSKKKTKSIINTATRGDEDKQAIATPWAFIHALEQRFGVPVDFDLAADAVNRKAGRWFDQCVDSLTRDWSKLGVGATRHAETTSPEVRLAYLNPPFAHIKPWAEKVVGCRWLKRWTVMLAPASYSTDWFLELDGKVVRDAIPRIQFEGATHLYPKDLTLVVAGFGMVGAGYWDWRVSYLQYCFDRRIEPEKTHTKGVRKLVDGMQLNELVLPQPDFNWTPMP